MNHILLTTSRNLLVRCSNTPVAFSEEPTLKNNPSRLLILACLKWRQISETSYEFRFSLWASDRVFRASTKITEVWYRSLSSYVCSIFEWHFWRLSLVPRRFCRRVFFPIQFKIVLGEKPKFLCCAVYVAFHSGSISRIQHFFLSMVFCSCFRSQNKHKSSYGKFLTFLGPWMEAHRWFN